MLMLFCLSGEHVTAGQGQQHDVGVERKIKVQRRAVLDIFDLVAPVDKVVVTEHASQAHSIDVSGMRSCSVYSSGTCSVYWLCITQLKRDACIYYTTNNRTGKPISYRCV